MEIVTGSTGEVHVTPIDDAVRNASVGYLDRKIVFDVYDVFAATIVANREIHVSSGYGENQGRIFKIDDGDYDSVSIENGTQGAKRADLIVARYSMDIQTGFEDISLAVIKGELSSTSYIDPTYETGDINSAIISSTFHDDFPLYRVRLDGTQIVAVDRLFTPVPDGGRIGVLEAAFEAHKARFDSTNYRTNLASESAVYPSRVDADGQGNINVRPGVEGVLPATHGGTGQNNLKSGANSLIGALDTNGIAPTNNDYYIGTTPGTTGFQRKPLATLWEWISSKLSNLGYGDMLKSYFCDNPESERPTVKVSRGGTGSTDGTINGVKLATSNNGTTKGYIDANGNFKSFRQPTGNAVVGNVLSGKTFANASSDALTGTMANYSGSSRRTVTPSGGTGNEQLSLSAGYHDSIIVNRTNPYNAGVSAAQAVTWTETIIGGARLYVGAYAPSNVEAVVQLPIKNLIKIKNTTEGRNVEMTYTARGQTTNRVVNPNSEWYIPEGTTQLWAKIVGDDTQVRSPNPYFSILATFQAKILR